MNNNTIGLKTEMSKVAHLQECTETLKSKRIFTTTDKEMMPVYHKHFSKSFPYLYVIKESAGIMHFFADKHDTQTMFAFVDSLKMARRSMSEKLFDIERTIQTVEDAIMDKIMEEGSVSEATTV